MAVDLVVDLVALEAGAKRGRDRARDAKALVTVVEDVEEGEAGVLVDGLVGRGVDEVPGGPDVRVGDVERLVQISEAVDWVLLAGRVQVASVLVSQQGICLQFTSPRMSRDSW